MKQLAYTITFAALLVFSNSCKKDFLDVPPQGQLTEEQALIDPAAADKMVAGVYNSLYLQGTVGLKYLILGEIASDNSDKGSEPNDPGFGAIEIDPFAHNANTGILNDVWTDHYTGIAFANKTLNILNSGTYEEATKNRLIGEVRFIRGLYYFNLVRIFGGVPKLIRVPATSEAYSDEFQTRASKEEIYKVIEEDLLFGVNNLPERREAGSQVGRATKGAAQALLSKVYLYQENWQGAYEMSQAVINSGKYDLHPNYALLFREVGENSIESVFEVQATPIQIGTECEGISKNYSNFQGPRGTFPKVTIDGRTYEAGDLGFGLNTPTSDLAAAYEPNDQRRDATIIFTSPTDVVTLWDGFPIPPRPAVVNERYNYKGYHSPFKEMASCNGDINDKDNKPKNIRVIRYAEVLLINAEAAAHIGADALTPLQKVRARAGLTTTSATIDDIWEERRLELAMEGDRFFDLVRQGRAGEVLRAHGKPFVTGKHEVFPIPQAQIDFSGGRMIQNPNY
ncbi:MAG TPA: RagB/SusD family nutrient uptake outer membrane protein [Flavisolibacter sp.]|nr:RagB/SusD family nutrient uptake outer membrane protein [Flavisolibacter sp.]